MKIGHGIKERRGDGKRERERGGDGEGERERERERERGGGDGEGEADLMWNKIPHIEILQFIPKLNPKEKIWSHVGEGSVS